MQMASCYYRSCVRYQTPLPSSAQFLNKSTGYLTTLNPLEQHQSLFVTLDTNQENEIKTELLSTVVD